MDVQIVWSGSMELGEGPVWDERKQLLWFVDIKKHKIHCLDPLIGKVSSWVAPAQVGWILPAERDFYLAGLQSGLFRFHPEAGEFSRYAVVEPHLPGNRLNDATIGPDGAIWFGSMDDSEASPTGQVYRLYEGALTTTKIPAVPITNGPALSGDGQTLYHVDTLGGAIYAVPVAANGETGPPREFISIAPDDGHPDGVTVDAADNIWVALWGGSAVRCYAPDGRLLREVRFPASNITKIAFGGRDLLRAYVTSARAGLSPEELALQPDAGSIFSFDLDVPGRPLPLAKIDPA